MKKPPERTGGFFISQETPLITYKQNLSTYAPFCAMIIPM